MLLTVGRLPTSRTTARSSAPTPESELAPDAGLSATAKQAPAVAERMAAWMVKDTRDELFERFSLQRFTTGKLERETMIIG